MHKRSKLLLVGLAAAMLLSMAVGNASARNLSLNEQSWRAVWTPLTFTAAGRTVRCNVTLEGSFHYRTIVKRLEALLGFVTRAIANTCAGGSATVLTNTLPWHTRYDGFSGTLPNITDIRLRLISASFLVFPTGAPRSCLARTTTANPAIGIVNIGAGGRADSLRAEEGARIPLEEFFCAFAGEGTFSGTTTSLVKLGGGALFVRLI